jgi:hypothetical protein
VTIPLAPRTARAIDLAIGERTDGPVFLAADGRRLDRHGAGRIDDDEATLGGRVRDALGADTSCVEEVRVLSATAYQQLPESAICRLGAKPGQKNLLVRIVLRDLEKTLTNQTANALRDRIYRALHQGTEYQWAG